MTTRTNPTAGRTVVERAYLWPLLATRRFGVAFRMHWKRIVAGAAAGWVAAVVLGAVALALLENRGFLSRSTSDSAGIAIVLGGVALGALCAYALRPAGRPEAGARSTPGVRPGRARAANR